MIARTLEGLKFRSVSDVEGGDVGPSTIFDYHQADDLIWARYEGGAVRLGFLVGKRDGDQLEFRYTQLRTDGTTATGHCRSTLEEREDGTLVMNEIWQWDSADGSGTSQVEEIRDQPL
jgi:hypothetical protein